MEQKSILIVEDDTDINRLLCKILKKEGYWTNAAYSGTEALLWLEKERPDLMLLDLMLPGIPGEEVIRLVREEKKEDFPILVLSAKSGLEHKLETITDGADDYITKPFEPVEVALRVMAALRRSGSGGGRRAEECLHYKKLTVTPASRRVEVAGEEISLTPHEYEILTILLQQPDKVFSREALYEQVWKNGYYGEDNTVNVHVSNIRKKIGALDPGEDYIKTVWGIGFTMA